MKKLLVIICVWSLIASPVTWAEDEVVLTPIVDTVTVVEDIVDEHLADVIPDIEPREELQNPIDTYNEWLDVSELEMSPIMTDTVDDMSREKDSIDIKDDDATIDIDSQTTGVDPIQETPITPIIVDLAKEEKPDDMIVSDTDMRTISIQDEVVTIVWK